MNKKYYVNGQIKARNVVLIDQFSNKVGTVLTNEAMKLADNANLDLVQISQDYTPICKLMDYSKMKYEESKKAKNSNSVMKEVRLGYNISEHDLETKNKQVLKFLEKKYKVLYVLKLDGCQYNLRSQADVKLKNMLTFFEDCATWNGFSKNNRTISTMLSPK